MADKKDNDTSDDLFDFDLDGSSEKNEPTPPPKQSSPPKKDDDELSFEEIVSSDDDGGFTMKAAEEETGKKSSSKTLLIIIVVGLVAICGLAAYLYGPGLYKSVFNKNEKPKTVDAGVLPKSDAEKSPTSKLPEKSKDEGGKAGIAPSKADDKKLPGKQSDTCWRQSWLGVPPTSDLASRPCEQ
jgi:hypothetical protein